MCGSTGGKYVETEEDTRKNIVFPGLMQPG
jgi:hypothetical protein